MGEDRIEKLERELAGMKPAGLPAELAERLAAEPADESLSFADRVLVLFGTMGSIAAAVIVAVMVWQLSSPPPKGPTAAEIAARQQRAAEYQQLLAAR